MADIEELVERLRLIAAWHTRGGPMPSKPCPNKQKALSEAATALSAQQREIAELRGALKRIYLAGHSEGWTGNQCRRDVQHIDAEKGWNLYVKNGALAAALNTPSQEGEKRREPRQPGAV